MTFTEAAIEVLRQAGKPLHYKKIAEIAIEKNLLSHVGKTPETTMSSRLATMVRKDRGDAPILKVKPGVFALRDFPEAVIEEATDDEESEQPKAKAEPPDVVEEAEESDDEAEPSRAAPLPGSELYPEEEDDDELILANLDHKESGGKRSRGSRRRGGRRRGQESRGQESRNQESRGREPRGRNRAAQSAVEGNWNRKSEDNESAGADLADAIARTLEGRPRRQQGYLGIAEALVRAGRLSGSAEGLAPTLAAAARGDNARRTAQGERPRFRAVGDGLALTSWDLPPEAVQAEKDAIRAAQRQREAVRRAFVRRLRDLPDASLLELVASWLNALGVRSIRGVRPGSDGFHLAGTLKQGPHETPLAIAIFRGRQPLGREAVVDVRGALHHYGHAQNAWLITLGQIRPEAATEARAEATTPCALFDADRLAESMERAGIGITRVSVALASLDMALLDALSPGGVSSSNDRDRERDEGEAPNGSSGRRRRGRRRGRRRPAGEGTEQQARPDGESSADRAEASDGDGATESSETASAEAESAPAIEPEAPELTSETEA